MKLNVRSNNLDFFFEMSSFAIDYNFSVGHDVDCKVTIIDRTVDLGVDCIPVGKKT